MRQKPWEAIGMSRATWYRRGKPAKPRTRITAADTAKAFGMGSARSYCRMMRALTSELGPYVASGQMTPAFADRILSGGPEQVRRFLRWLAEVSAGLKAGKSESEIIAGLSPDARPLPLSAPL
jgi:hypothetical protein